MKALDIELILTVLRSINILVDNCTSASDKLDEKARLLSLLPSMCDILERNDDVQIHLAASVYLKNLIKVCNELLLENSSYVQRVMKTIRNLLKIPTDKSFESASIYVGNLTLLAFDKLKQHNYEILQ